MIIRIVYKMEKNKYDIIIVGAGSAGLSVGLFLNKIGLKVLMIARSEREIGGECLNDGCIPSKALIHIAKIANNARLASGYGWEINGRIDIKKVMDYVSARQEIIRVHENVQALREQGIAIALGAAKLVGKNELEVNGDIYSAGKIVIATGSRPKKLEVPGTEMVTWFDNENIFSIDKLPERLLVVGGGPVGIEIAQAMNRFGCKVIVVHNNNMILEHEDTAVTRILLKHLEGEGIEFVLNSNINRFTSANEAIVKLENDQLINIGFDTVFVATGRILNFDTLQLRKAGVQVNGNKIIVNNYLQTTNKHIFLCGDVAGDLKFSHVAEFHARILINNFLSPFKKKLSYDHISWVTFTDPEIATFGLNETQLKKRNIIYERIDQDFSNNDRAITDNYRYGKLVLFVSKGNWLQRKKVLGGTMIAPNAGELIQELILLNEQKLPIHIIFNKIYPYPVAARINQQLVMNYKEKGLATNTKKLLQWAFRLFS
jgi:pyruvate/2-oxoglutarate dehydrogenase complex dihydrolipoamide dehydrogenase (E3) component